MPVIISYPLCKLVIKHSACLAPLYSKSRLFSLHKRWRTDGGRLQLGVFRCWTSTAGPVALLLFTSRFCFRLLRGQIKPNGLLSGLFRGYAPHTDGNQPRVICQRLQGLFILGLVAALFLIYLPSHRCHFCCLMLFTKQLYLSSHRNPPELLVQWLMSATTGWFSPV